MIISGLKVLWKELLREFLWLFFKEADEEIDGAYVALVGDEVWKALEQKFGAIASVARVTVHPLGLLFRK